MNHFCEEWLQDWCQENGWTDLIIEGSQYWAFPPGAVMPEPIPTKVLRLIKSQKGLSTSEKIWSSAGVIVSVMGVILTYLLKSPMPLVFAFAFGAITVGVLEIDDF